MLLFLPDRSDNPFWGPYGEFAEAVADSIGVDLSVIFAATNDRSDYMERLRAALSASSKPDYVAVLPYFGAVRAFMDETARHGVPIVTLNSELGRSDLAEVGMPRERYENWILKSRANDEEAGFLLAKAVDKAARERFGRVADGTVTITALGGNQLASSSLYRREGLERFVRDSGGLAALNQFVFTDWSYERGKEVAEGLIRRYPATQAIWAANLPLGLAVSDSWNAMARNRLAPAMGLVSGPFDDRALDGIENGTFSAVVGGHFLEGGIVMVLLLDHFNGLDFYDDIGTGFRVPFKAVDRDNVEEIRTALGRRDWHGQDFTHLSKCHHEGLIHYDFSLDTVFPR